MNSCGSLRIRVNSRDNNVEAKKAKTSISDAMKTKARMALKAQGGREIKAINRKLNMCIS